MAERAPHWPFMEGIHMQHKSQSATTVATTPTPAEITAIRKANPVSAGLNGFPDRVVLRPEVELAVGRKKSWIYDAVKRGEFPAPFSLGGGRVAWWLSDIAAYLEALKRKQQEAA